MREDYIVEQIRNGLEQKVTVEVESLIEERVKNFREELECRKHKYIADILNEISIVHNYDSTMNEMNYKVIFENRK